MTDSRRTADASKSVSIGLDGASRASAATPSGTGPAGDDGEPRFPEPGDVDPGAAVVGEITGEADEAGRPTSLRQRFMRPQTLISFVFALAIAVFFFMRLDINPGEFWDAVRKTNPLLYFLAFVVFYAQFLIRAERWKIMLRRVGIDPAHGYHIPSLPRMLEIYVVSWFTNCIVPAKLGDAFRSYLFKQETKAPISSTLGTIVTERLIDLAALFVAMVISGWVVFGTHLPGDAGKAVIGGVALLVVGAVALGMLWVLRDHLEGLVPERMREQYVRLHGAIFATLRRPESFLGAGFVLWMMEGLRVFLVCKALDVHISFMTALFVALVASLLTALPFTPAGLGVVEGAMTALLIAVGVDHSVALAVTLLDRLIGYWSVIAIGATLYVLRLRRELVTPVEVTAASPRVPDAAR